MTVTYRSKVASATWSPFLRLLFRWRGSIYKLVLKEFAIFVLLYYIIGLIYRFALTGIHKRRFEVLSLYLKEKGADIPMSFVLGFYVSMVVGRWWQEFNQIPWPDRMALFMSASIHGMDDRARALRRTIMRYLCLSYVITMSSISPGVKRRFPSYQEMTDAGFMLPNEQKVIENMKTPHNKYFVPMVWSANLIGRARKDGKIKDDMAMKTLLDEVNAYRGALGGLFNYDWVTVPLVYTQVVTIAVYTYFMSVLVGGQFLVPEKTLATTGPSGPVGSATPTPAGKAGGQWNFDFYLPVFTFLQFFFFMGWLKVAESMVNPFGDDDDDFEINSTIDRNLQVSYLVVDEMHEDHPELLKDAYWDNPDFELPYADETVPTKPHLGSAMDIRKDDGNSSKKDDEKKPAPV